MSRIICGEVLRELKKLDSGIADMCVTSPPYYGLRDYDMPEQIGLEETPEAYITRLVEVFAEVRRVLRDDGTLWLNIGDSYATTSGAQPPTNTRNKLGHTAKTPPSGYKTKDLMGIPWMLAFALRADGWYLRQDIIWAKPNAMPESVTDRCTKAHEYLFLLSKRPRYYFDARAIQEPVAAATLTKKPQSFGGAKGREYTPEPTDPNYRGGSEQWGRVWSREESNADGLRNRRSVWTIPTANYSLAHFATFPPALVAPCILAGSRPGGVVLDPFLGSGTTGAVAQDLGRDWIGIELNPEYCELAERRTAYAQQTIEQHLGGTP